MLRGGPDGRSGAVQMDGHAASTLLRARGYEATGQRGVTWHLRRKMCRRGCSGVRSWKTASDVRQEPSLVDCFRRLYGAHNMPILTAQANLIDPPGHGIATQGDEFVSSQCPQRKTREEERKPQAPLHVSGRRQRQHVDSLGLFAFPPATEVAKEPGVRLSPSASEPAEGRAAWRKTQPLLSEAAAPHTCRSFENRAPSASITSYDSASAQARPLVVDAAVRKHAHIQACPQTGLSDGRLRWNVPMQKSKG